LATRAATSETLTEEEISVEKIKRETLNRRIQAARALAERIQVQPDGSRVFVRFSRGERIEHVVLMVSFAILAVTGLLQTFSELALVGWLIDLVGGVDAIRVVHRLAALVSAAQSVYHVWRILETWFVKRQLGGMWPYLQDARDLVQMIMFNAGLAQKRPQFDRFTIEEKLEYWALIWGNLVMGITGFIMWFPLVVTAFLPGVVFPVARAVHRWEAILAALAILTWHMYHGCIKDGNRSIFTGLMSEEEMQHVHPLEYQRILAAAEYLKKIAAAEGPADSETFAKEKTGAGPIQAALTSQN
jgi:cytochrome b subunit of formate dehydrogenase